MYQYKREPLSDDEVNRLINVCEKSTEKFIIYTLLDTGMRVSELANLKKDDILWQERRIVVFGKGGIYGKKTKRRVIPLTERVYAIFSAWFVLNEKVKFGKRNIQIHVRKIANKAHISKKVSPHVLRHTFAVNCVKKGVSSRSLQMLLGHDRLTTTEIYLNMSPEDACREFTQKF